MSSLPELSELKTDEKLQLLEAVWNSLAGSPQDIPVWDWQIEELNRRRAYLAKHPEAGLTWEEAERRIRGQHD